MTNEDLIWQLRRLFARSARLGTNWTASRKTISLSEELKTRRELRRLRASLFRQPVFHRLLNHSGRLSAARDLVKTLMILSLFSSRPITRKDAKEAREKYLKAKSDVEMVARTLREYTGARPNLSAAVRKAFLQAANELEGSPMFAIEKRLRSASSIVDFGMFGQQGDKRAFAINWLHFMLPANIKNRYATIRELLNLIGVESTAPLVRSTILKGHT